jgi:phospholipase/carboxylesterase/glyoxalase family protein
MKMSVKELGFIHSFVPAQESDLSFTLLLLHGTGGNERDLLSLGRSLAPSAALLSPRGKILENGLPRFFHRFPDGVFDLEDLKFRTHELADFMGAASTVYRFDLSKVIAVGYSNGANIAASMLLLRPRLLAGAVLFRPMVPLIPEPPPDLSGIPIFVLAGRFDPIVSQEQTKRLVTLLQSYGADVTPRWQNDGHVLNAKEVYEAKEWLSELLAIL